VVRVAHDQRDARGGNAQLLGDRLRQRRADVLPDLDLAREHRDRAILADVQRRADRVGGGAQRLGLAGLLGFERETVAGHHQHDPPAPTAPANWRRVSAERYRGASLSS